MKINTPKTTSRTPRMWSLCFSILLMLLIISSCKKEDVAEPDESVLLSQTKGSWKVDKVILDNREVTASYASLIVNFEEAGSFSCEHPIVPVWPAAGTFTSAFADNQWTLTRNDQLEIKLIMEPDTNQMTMRFFWPGHSPDGRVVSVSGQYQFTLSKV